MNKYILICFMLLLGLACKKDNPPPAKVLIPDRMDSLSVLVINEGNFQFGNASLTLINTNSGTVQEDLFKATNARPLGDVAQSACEYNNNIYIVVNNSGKIEVINKSDFKWLATIHGLTSPRYMLPVTESKAYVTDLYANKMAILDLKTNQVSGYITCKGWTEELLQVGNEVWVTNKTSDYVYVIDIASDKCTDSVKVNYASNSIVKDKDNHLWIMCWGDKQKNSLPALLCINPSSRTILKTFTFDDNSFKPEKLEINKTMDTLYFINTHIYSMPVESSSLPKEYLINASGTVIYNMNIDNSVGNIYFTNAKDYVQKGEVYCYSKGGQLLHTYSTGIIPGEMLFLLK